MAMSGAALAGAAAIGSAGEIAGGFLQNAANRAATGKQMRFADSQARINRDFQERMSSTAWQRGVADMRKAGINPMLAVSKGGASVPSGDSASGSSLPQSNPFSNMSRGVTSAVQAAMLREQIQNLKVTNQKIASDILLNRQNVNTARQYQSNLAVDNQLKLANVPAAENEANFQKGWGGKLSPYWSHTIGAINDVVGIGGSIANAVSRVNSSSDQRRSSARADQALSYSQRPTVTDHYNHRGEVIKTTRTYRK